MQPLTRVEGRAIPLGLKNVDTDIIIPAKWLKTISREGLGAGAFEALRAEPGNVIDDPAYAGANLLIAGENFGCGSSREHAAWALLDLGIARPQQREPPADADEHKGEEGKFDKYFSAEPGTGN